VRSGAFGVIPVCERTVDAVEVSFGEGHETVEGFMLNRLNHPLDVCLQVRGADEHLGDFEAR